MQSLQIDGVTIQVRVTDIAAGVYFYSQLLGREPDLNATDRFKEWEVHPGCWLQVTEGTQPMQGRLRFGVDDIDATVRWASQALSLDISTVERIAGLSAWCNFDDPWGNKLGFFQDLAK